MSNAAELGVEIRVIPGGKRDALEHGEDGVIKVRLRARAMEGKANEALREFLAKALGVPRRSVQIRIGEHSRNKVIAVEGMAALELRRRLSGGEV